MVRHPVEACFRGLKRMARQVQANSLGATRGWKLLERFYWKGKEWASLHATSEVSVHGVRLRVPVEFRRLMAADYEKGSMKLFVEALRPGAVVLDVGAHVGLYSLVAARVVGPSGRVYAFEPAPGNFRLLTQNVRLNSAENVTALQIALLDSEGAVVLNLGRSSGWNSLSRHPMASGPSKGIVVRGSTGDAILASRGVERVDVAKIDVEGAEVQVLRGLRRTLGNSPGCVLIVEVNPACLASAGFSAADLLSELDYQGFSAWGVDEDTGRRVEITPAIIASRLEKDQYWYANLFCTRRHARER